MKTQKIKKTGASSPAGTIIAAICIVIYIFALVQASVRIYLSIDDRKITAENEFTNISNTALSAGQQGFMDDHFIQTMNNALSSSRCIEALIITGPDGEYAFEHRQGYAVTWVNNSPRFANRIQFSKQIFHRPLPIQNLRNVNISAVATAFDYGEFTKVLKETLILILFGFALAFFTMLLQLLIVKPQENRQAAAGQDDFEPFDESYEESPGPSGLYSPRSNLGWEEYTKDRLDSELHRSASTEQDLTFIIMEFLAQIDDDQFKQAAEEVVSSFTSKDLVFEKGRNGISVIYPGISLETGIAKSQKFHQRIMEKLFYDLKDKDCLCIGLSSRSGRLLNADRMILEAGEALNRAIMDPDTSIIAFKSNLEKYREFVSKKP
ncbi:MAG: hypothetical protein LBH16_08560 [Treponema sp.]|jgi:hypothetical protein|nr:hypothetical protein [Treponema sp.]